MSAISKLMQARDEFHKRELKKSGWNDFSKFKYLELADFLIPALEIFSSLKLAALTSFTKELATMTITDLEDGSSVVITSPFGSAALKACHEVQNIGAVETYQRRYLWVAALEIVEHDAIDSATKPEEKTEKAKPVASISPNDVGKDFWNNANAEERAYLQGQIDAIRGHLAVNEAQAAATEFYAMKDQEEALAVWSQLGSKERAAIKQFKPEQKAA